jgi:hypothetical protein
MIHVLAIVHANVIMTVLIVGTYLVLVTMIVWTVDIQLLHVVAMEMDVLKPLVNVITIVLIVVILLVVV